MKLKIIKNENELEIKKLETDKDGKEVLSDFDYLDYINQYIEGLKIDFEFSEDVDDETKSKILNIDQEIATLVSDLINSKKE